MQTELCPHFRNIYPCLIRKTWQHAYAPWKRGRRGGGCGGFGRGYCSMRNNKSIRQQYLFFANKPTEILSFEWAWRALKEQQVGSAGGKVFVGVSFS